MGTERPLTRQLPKILEVGGYAGALTNGEHFAMAVDHHAANAHLMIREARQRGLTRAVQPRRQHDVVRPAVVELEASRVQCGQVRPGLHARTHDASTHTHTHTQTHNMQGGWGHERPARTHDASAHPSGRLDGGHYSFKQQRSGRSIAIAAVLPCQHDEEASGHFFTYGPAQAGRAPKCPFGPRRATRQTRHPAAGRTRRL